MSLTDTSVVQPRRRDQGLRLALWLVVIIVIGEYLARHFVLFWPPAIGSLRVNDMLATGILYAALVWLTLPAGKRSLASIGQAVGEILRTARRWQVWLAALVTTVAVILLSLVDQILWGSVQLPSVVSPWRWETTILEAAAPLLVPVSLLIVNCVVVPFAEEWLWRGLIQPRVVAAAGGVLGIAVTSALFSLKHAIIDASLGRLLALTGFGLVMGVLASRYGWRAAALAHALANTVATLLALAAGLPLG
ncbi:MAG: CPBP family intramembrane glutamic endopeptidase [Chloroflexota bacterium]|nr:MAG: hypothetical protein DIU80_16215 [Chloroflexota bacterium]